MKIFLSITILSAIITLTSCQKTPVATFTSDKSEYVAGETIKLTNTSTDGETFKWTFPDGTTGTVANYDYVTNDTDPEASLTFMLEAFSKNGKKTNSFSKTVSLKAATGNVTFWQMTGSGFLDTEVKLNGLTSTITSEFDAAPNCGESGSAAFSNLKVGSYNYTATDGFDVWSGTVIVKKNTCLTKELN